MNPLCKTLCAALALLTCSVAGASDVEVLHWWTSAGERRAVDVLKETMKASDLQWVDFAITGGGGNKAYSVLKSRMISGNPPAAAQIKGPTIQQWSRLGFLAPVSQQVTQGWDKLIPPTIQADMKVDGQYMAVPINIHRNWMWVNPTAFQNIGQPVPKTWADFIAAAPLLKKAGIEPLAIGYEDWQFGTLFETVLLGVAGADFYRSALVDLKPEALNSPQMISVFQTLAALRTFLPANKDDQLWDSAASRLMKGEAAVQVSGDWLKGELLAAGQQPGKDILCVPAPGTENSFIYTVDSMVMFNTSNSAEHKAQARFSRVLMNPDFQKSFSRFKGSVPVRTGIALNDFDSCAQASRKAFDLSEQEGTLVPSLSHSMAADERVKQSFLQVVAYFFTHPEVTAERASQQLKTAVTASH